MRKSSHAMIALLSVCRRMIVFVMQSFAMKMDYR